LTQYQGSKGQSATSDVPHLRVQSQGKNHLGSEEESHNIELLHLQQINGLHRYILPIV
jgi:hypothetical protein